MAWIALLKYCYLKNRNQPLPDPNGALSTEIPCSVISSANPCVGKLLNSMADSFGAGVECNANSRGQYTILTSTQNFEIGKIAAEVGTTAAMCYYAKNYPALELKEASIRKFKSNYRVQLKL